MRMDRSLGSLWAEARSRGTLRQVESSRTFPESIGGRNMQGRGVIKLAF